MSITYDYRTAPPVYPGHPVTCALAVLRHYAGRVSDAWKRTDHGWLVCEGEMSDCPTAGGHLSEGCRLIQRVLASGDVEAAIRAGDETWHRGRVIGGDHPDRFIPGQEQADRLKPQLRAALAALLQVQ